MKSLYVYLEAAIIIGLQLKNEWRENWKLFLLSFPNVSLPKNFNWHSSKWNFLLRGSLFMAPVHCLFSKYNLSVYAYNIKHFFCDIDIRIHFLEPFSPLVCIICLHLTLVLILLLGQTNRIKVCRSD